MTSYTRYGELGEHGQLDRYLSSTSLCRPTQRSRSVSRSGISSPRITPSSRESVNTYCGAYYSSSLSPTNDEHPSRPLVKFSNDYFTSRPSAANIDMPSEEEGAQMLPNNSAPPISRPIDVSIPLTQVFRNQTAQYETQAPALPEPLITSQESLLAPSPISTRMAYRFCQEELASASSFSSQFGDYSLADRLDTTPGLTMEHQLQVPGGSNIYNLSTILPYQQSYQERRSPVEQTTQLTSMPRLGEKEAWQSMFYESKDPDGIYEKSTSWSTPLTTVTHFGIWPSICIECADPSVSYHNLSMWLAHAWTQHPDIAQWLPQTCLWLDPPCLNPKKFISRKLWLDHVHGVHLKRFWCNVPDCVLRQGGPQETPFGTLAYLKRHDESMHETPIFCDKPFCAGRRSKLNRADKREEHAKWHGPFLCSFEGCSRRRIEHDDYGFASQALLDKHLRIGKHNPIRRRQT